MTVIGHGADLCTSTTRPTTTNVGTIIFETDTLSYRWWNGTGWEGVIPVGTLQSYAGTTPPSGWLFCFGQSLNATTTPGYTLLYNTIGTTYGGSSISAFSIPDLRGRAPHGKDDMGGTTASRVTSTSGIVGTTLGATGGDERLQNHTHTYSGTTGNDSPDHSHGLTRNFDVPNYGWSITGGGAGWLLAGSAQTYGASTRHQHTYSGTTANHNQTTGGASQNMPPTIITNYIIKF